MKKLSLIAFILICFSAFAQSGIPANVQNTFKQLYPNAGNVTWSEEQGFYIAAFSNNNTPTKLLIDPKGAVLHTSVKIAPSDLPTVSSSFITANYPGQTVSDAQLITMKSNFIRYEAIVGGKDLIFDSDGKFIHNVTGPIKQ